MSQNVIRWTELFSIGYNEIDDQHKKLIKVINDLYTVYPQTKDKNSIVDLLKRMIEYTKCHFDTEEKYLKKHNYSEANTHKKQHLDFITKVINFQEEYKETGGIKMTYDLIDFLRE